MFPGAPSQQAMQLICNIIILIARCLKVCLNKSNLNLAKSYYFQANENKIISICFLPVCGGCDELASSPISIIEFKCCTSLPVKYGVPGVCGAAEVDPDTRAEGAGDRCAAEGATSCEVPAKVKSFLFLFY